MTRSARFLAAAAAALVVGAGLGIATALRPSPEQVTATATPLGAPFRLVSDEDRPITDADLRGKPTVLYFGFTFCPEVCPTTLAELSGLMKKLGPVADRLNCAFVTVDPERDTPKVMHEYVSAFDPRIRGLTGSTDEIAAVARSYGAYYKKVPLDGGGYTMDHTASVFLLDAKGGFVGTIAYGEDEASALAKLKRLVAAGTA
jgi:protein SCO1